MRSNIIALADHVSKTIVPYNCPVVFYDEEFLSAIVSERNCFRVHRVSGLLARRYNTVSALDISPPIRAATIRSMRFPVIRFGRAIRFDRFTVPLGYIHLVAQRIGARFDRFDSVNNSIDIAIYCSLRPP